MSDSLSKRQVSSIPDNTNSMAKNIFFLPFLLFAFYTSASSQSLDKIISNYLSARGQSSFNELQTLIVKGERTFLNTGLTCEFIQYIKYPVKFRDDIWIDKNQLSIVYNNGEGEIFNPLSTGKKIEKLADKGIDKIQSMEKSDLKGLLYNFIEKCKQVTYDGINVFNGEELYRIKIVTFSLDTIEYLIETRDFLLKQVVYFANSQDRIIVTYDNYKVVKSMQLPFEILHFNNNGCFRKEIISEYIINPSIADSLYSIE